MLCETAGYLTNIKLTDIKRTFFKNKLDGLTALSDSQHNEVLFFATAHFLFFNFLAAAQANPKAKAKECNHQRFIKSGFRLNGRNIYRNFLKFSFEKRTVIIGNRLDTAN